MSRTDNPLDRLVTAVLKSSKHGRICEEFIRRVGAEELPKRRNLKEAIKATKNKLHQVGGAYLDVNMPYARWLDLLGSAARSPDGDDLLDACREVMSHHASTMERLPILDSFYTTVLASLTPVRSVLDVACGLNPLAIPWMPLTPGAAYYAYDIYHDMIEFVGAFMALTNVNGDAHARDVAQFVPPQKVDVALVLKTIPCLEQIDKSAGLQLLESLNADYVVVSFPVHSLGGYDKGMATNYETRLRDLLAGKPWLVQRFEFETELVFLVDKRCQPT
jgi:16S rRNA (guanine(1405)-N(7))-methyltransferase